MSLIYNNPGNIRPGEDYAGETGEFYTALDGSKYVIFDSPEMGLRALFVDLRSKITQFNLTLTRSSINMRRQLTETPQQNMPVLSKTRWARM